MPYRFRGLLDSCLAASEAQRYATVRQPRWADGVTCQHCDGGDTIRRCFDSPQRLCQRYQCKACGKRFDDLTETVLSGHHQPLSAPVPPCASLFISLLVSLNPVNLLIRFGHTQNKA